MAGRLEGRTAVVTGAGGGIGLATARRFADEGANEVAIPYLRRQGKGSTVNNASFVAVSTFLVDGGISSAYVTPL